MSEVAGKVRWTTQRSHQFPESPNIVSIWERKPEHGGATAFEVMDGCDREWAEACCRAINGRRTIPLDHPWIVCLCGSTRFHREFVEWNLRFTLQGKIVLSIGAATGTDEKHFGHWPPEEMARIKAALDELHKRKIDLADEVFVLNVGGYIGESTRSEIEYANGHGKPVFYLELGT